MGNPDSHFESPGAPKMTKRWNTLWISGWGFWAGLIYDVVDQFFLSDYEDEFLE